MTFPSGTWGRLIGLCGHHDGDPLGIYGGGPKFDYDFGAVQVGLDLYRAENQTAAATMPASMPLRPRRGRCRAQPARPTFKGGEDKFDAFSLGGYWTHFGPSDWYLDGVLQATWYDGP